MNLYQRVSADFIRYSIFFFTACICISNLLWFGIDMTLPKVPWIGDATYSLSYFYFDNLFCFISIAIVIYGVWSRNQNSSLGIGVILFSITLILDVKRCNALFYFFICTWVLYWFHLKYKIELKSIFILHISALYIWSGVHKMNPFYFENSHQFLMNTFKWTDFLINNKISSDLSSCFESVCGILLLINQTRKLAIILLTSMHLFILATLVKLEWNLMVIPWNLFMIYGLVSIFYFKFNMKNEWLKYNIQLKLFLITTSLIFPALFLVDKINPAFAYTMYSGRNVIGNLVIDSSDIIKIKSPYRSKLVPYYQSLNLLDINYLSPNVSNAPFNYSEFVFKKIFKATTKDFNQQSTALIISKFPLGSDTAIYEYVYMY